MQTELMLDSLSKSVSVKGAIIDILSRKWPLSLKQIYSKLKSEHALEVSYQAAHKVVQRLLVDGIIVANNREYQLSLSWIRKSQNRFSALESLYVEKKKDSLAEVMEHGQVTLSFETPIQAGRFFLHEFYQWPNSEGKADIDQYGHIWPTVGFNPEEYATFKRVLADSPKYVVAQGDSKLDRLFAKNWLNCGARVKLGVPLQKMPDVMVHGDFVAQIFLPGFLLDAWDELCLGMKGITQMELDTVFKVLSHQNEKTTVLLSKAPAVADRIRTSVLSNFRIKCELAGVI